jgi:hypothetical protein
MSKCLVLFIGESFREGGQFSRIRNTKDSFEKQQIASLSHIDFLNYIKNTYSYNIDVIINTYTTIFENDLKYWYDQYLINYISNDKLVGLENLLNNGIKSINTENYDFILSIRIDLYIKYYFFLKFNVKWSKITFPFICWITEYKQIWDDIIFSTVENNHAYKTFNNEPVVCDTIIFIPKKYFYLFEKRIYLNHDAWYNFKENYNLINDDFEFMINSLHDADSYKDFNPFYYMISRSQNRVCHGKGYSIDYTKFSTTESFIIKNDLENIKDDKYYNEYYDEHSNTDNHLQIEKIEYLSNYEIQSEFTEKHIIPDNIFNIKISKKNRNNLRNGFILNNDCFELNKYYYSNNSRLLLYSNNHLYFEKKDFTKKDYNWFGFEIDIGLYYISFDIKILNKVNTDLIENCGLKIHFPYEILYNDFLINIEKDIWRSVKIPINIKKKQLLIFIFDNYNDNLKLEIKDFKFLSISKKNKENISIVLYETPNNISNNDYSINYTNINKMIIEPLSNIYNTYIFISVLSSKNINILNNLYKPYDTIELNNKDQTLNINNIFIENINNINYFTQIHDITFNFLLLFSIDSIFKKSITKFNFYINKFNFISYYIPYIDNKISNSYNFISIPYNYISNFYNLLSENINNIDICYSIYYYLSQYIDKSNFNFIYDENYDKNTRTQLIKYLSDNESISKHLNNFKNNNGYFFNNNYLYNIYYSNNYSKILKSNDNNIIEFYFYKKTTIKNEKYQWIGLYLQDLEKINIDKNIKIKFDIKFIKKINIDNSNLNSNTFGLKIHEPLEFINDWINIANNNLNNYNYIEINTKINIKSQYIILNFDNYLEEVEFYIKNFKIILEYIE